MPFQSVAVCDICGTQTQSFHRLMKSLGFQVLAIDFIICKSCEGKAISILVDRWNKLQ